MVSLKQISVHVGLAFLVTFLLISHVLGKLWSLLFLEQPLVSDCIACSLLVTCLLLLKYSVYNVECAADEDAVRRFSALCLVQATLLALIEPEFGVSWGSVYLWLVFAGCCCVILVIFNLLPVQDNPVLCMLMAVVIGAAIGIQVFINYGIPGHMNQAVLYVTSCVVITFSILFSWKLAVHIESALLYCYGLLAVSNVCIMMTYKEEEPRHLSRSILFASISLLILAFNGKLYSLLRKYPSKSTIPTVNNLLALSTFCLMFLYNYLEKSEPYLVIATSLVLLILQPDLYLLYSFPSYKHWLISATICTLVTWTSALLGSDILASSLHSHYSRHYTSSVLATLCSYIEITLLFFFSLPLLILFYIRLIFATALVRDDVLVTIAPITILFLLTGSTIYSWLLSVIHAGLALWLLYSIIPE